VAAVVDKGDCISFETCVDECSQKAITMGDDEIAVIDTDKGIVGGRCIEVSPSEATSPEG